MEKRFTDTCTNAWASIVETACSGDGLRFSDVANDLALQQTRHPDRTPHRADVQVDRGGEWQDLQTYSGLLTVAIDETLTFDPADYVGPEQDRIQLRIHVRYDDVTVTVDGIVVDHEDFQDQTSDRWIQVIGPGVGDFAALWTNLRDLDPCRTNFSPQVAFVGPTGTSPDAPLRVSHYPNPFNPAVTIALDLPRQCEVRLKIYDLRGALVKTLVDERLAAGRHEITWDGTDDRSAAVASGTYFSEVKTGREMTVRKLTLVR